MLTLIYHYDTIKMWKGKRKGGDSCMEELIKEISYYKRLIKNTASIYEYTLYSGIIKNLYIKLNVIIEKNKE